MRHVRLVSIPAPVKSDTPTVDIKHGVALGSLSLANTGPIYSSHAEDFFLFLFGKYGCKNVLLLFCWDACAPIAHSLTVLWPAQALDNNPRSVSSKP